VVASLFVFNWLAAILVAALLRFALGDEWRGEMIVPDEVVLAITSILVAMVLHTNYNGLMNNDGRLTWI
jgi:hypothetical protein